MNIVWNASLFQFYGQDLEPISIPKKVSLEIITTETKNPRNLIDPSSVYDVSNERDNEDSFDSQENPNTNEASYYYDYQLKPVTGVPVFNCKYTIWI